MEGLFQGAAFLGEVAAAVRRDTSGEGAVDLGEAFLRDDRDQLGATPGADEGDRADALDGEVGQQVGRFGGGGTADGGALLALELGERRLPEGEDQFAARGGVVGDLDHRKAGETAGGHRGLGGGRGGQQEDGRGAVAGAEAAQTAQDLGDMGAEDPAVGVALVDDDVLQRLEEGGPAGVGREYAAVQHVGVGEDVVGVLADPLAFLEWSIAVVHGGSNRIAQRM